MHSCIGIIGTAKVGSGWSGWSGDRGRLHHDVAILILRTVSVGATLAALEANAEDTPLWVEEVALA